MKKIKDWGKKATLPIAKRNPVGFGVLKVAINVKFFFSFSGATIL